MPFPIETIACPSWALFKSVSLPGLFTNGIASRGQYYFRGQGSDSWPLISGFDRWYKSQNNLSSAKSELALQFISFFEDEVSRLTPDVHIPPTDDDKLALAQHYGVPTRLLDWTESPYIAAFFAFSGISIAPDPQHQVAIWCLDTKTRLWRDDTGIRLLSVLSPYNERLKNQLGKFTLLQSPFDTVEDHVGHCDRSGRTLRKIVLPASEANTALSDLDFMGINYSTIYPGVEGCARAARLRVLLNASTISPARSVP